MREPNHFNTSDLPWEKMSSEIARTTGMSPVLIRNIRKHVFGRSGPTFHWEQRYGALPWDTVDWVNENNTMVGRRFGVQPSVVRLYRIDNHKPISLMREQPEDEAIDEAKLAAVDWTLYADVEIGDQLGVCRERARQLRVECGIPCLFQHMSADGRSVTRWVYTNRATLEGQLAWKVVEACPIKTHTQQIRKLLRAACVATGVKLDWSNATSKHIGKYCHFNFALPNSVLACVWGLCQASCANYRHQNKKCKPLWRFCGFSLQMNSPVFKDMLVEEIKKAISRGITPDLEAIRLRYRVEFIPDQSIAEPAVK